MHRPRTSTAAYSLTPLGVIHSDYPDKFGVPRQPGLAPAARATLVLTPPFNDPLAVRGLFAFSHLWLTFIFHQTPQARGQFTPLVRPPRLGGNQKTGVFASRSPNRPNRLGLSLVRLEAVETQGGVRLVLGGCDLIDQTPVVDIKPYIPWVEARPDARAGFAPTPPPEVNVVFYPEACALLDRRGDGASLKALIETGAKAGSTAGVSAHPARWRTRSRGAPARCRREVSSAGRSRIRQRLTHHPCGGGY